MDREEEELKKAQRLVARVEKQRARTAERIKKQLENEMREEMRRSHTFCCIYFLMQFFAI